MITKSQISNIFREIECEIGTTELLNIVLEIISESVDIFKAKDLDDFYNQFRDLLFVIKDTKPRIAIIIFYFCEIWDLIEKNKDKFKNLNQLNLFIKKTVKDIKSEIHNDNKIIVKKGTECIENNDNILIHSHSNTVLKIIAKAKKSGKKFKVILAEQEREKTVTMIKILRSANIDFIVVPEFMLSHMEDQVNKVFLGGLTFNSNFDFITDAGTNSVVSEFHGVNIPVYIFLSSKKFALWNSTKEHGTHKVHQTRTCDNSNKAITYDRVKFSHDRIKIESVDYIITEEGKFKQNEIKELYTKKYSERKKWQEKHFST